MELPRDLMYGVFFRLQCRDVVSCRGVCRAWYNPLSDPNFSTYYTRFSPHHDRSDYFFLIHIDANGEFIWRPIKPKVPRSSETRTIVEVVGSCDGLVFLLLRNFNYPHTTEPVYVCNPLLGGRCHALRKFFRVNKLVGRVEYKLGFVPPTNKIKLLSIGFDGDGRVLEAHILTFRGDDKWRKLKDPLTLLFHFSNGICFTGAYHWVAEDENVDWICTSDNGEEKCGRILKPPDLLQL
ncbi:hypothetical protein CDL12_02511 [Handroanthus impetiginosus]|uniref:F-box domain-containing protein n=1 Tax=Handroanthus impetiginosus TaxID=429701 RepID=A0A2G9I4T9_9LAMI|nr:hypothetical protein CDL12_02511 [Handroanthus impetiginosus]